MECGFECFADGVRSERTYLPRENPQPLEPLGCLSESWTKPHRRFGQRPHSLRMLGKKELPTRFRLELALFQFLASFSGLRYPLFVLFFLEATPQKNTQNWAPFRPFGVTILPLDRWRCTCISTAPLTQRCFSEPPKSIWRTGVVSSRVASSSLRHVMVNIHRRRGPL